MRLISARAWALVVLSAVLQILAFPIAGPLPVWRSIFSWICLVPFLLALLVPSRSGESISLRQSFSLGYLCGCLWYAGNCYWIYQTMYLYGGLPKIVSFAILILFALYLGLYHALFALLFAWIRKSGTSIVISLLSVPFLWVTVELARARITGFPWDLLGYSQIDNSFLTRLGPLTGVMGMSFFIGLLNAAITLLFVPTQKRISMAPRIAIVLAAAVQLSGVHLAITPVGGPHPTAVMLQENLEVGAQGREVKPLSQAEELDSFSDASLHPAWPSGQYAWSPNEIGNAKLTPDVIPTIVVWPEAPSELHSYDPGFRERMNTLARKTGAPLIIGSLGVDFDKSPIRGYYLYDSASLFDAEGNYEGRYDKIHLVPWGEYIPFKRFFAFAQKLTQGVGDMDPGTQRTVFSTGSHRYGIFVCYESIFGDEVRQFVKNGAEVLVEKTVR